MRITSLEIENFRCFGTRTRVDFAPITLLFGANSVGKSSILGALDLMRVLMSEVSPTITEDRCVGTFAELGGFHSMVHDHNTDQVIKLRLSVDLSGATTEQDLDDEDAPLVTEESRDPLEAVDDELEVVWVECTLTWSRVRGRAWVSSFMVGTAGQPESLVEIQSPGDRRHPSQLSVWLQHPLLNPEPNEDGLTELERALEEAAFSDHRRFETDSPAPVFRHALSLYGIGGAVPQRAQPPRLSNGSLTGPLPPAVHTIRQLLHRTVLGIADRVREALAEVVRIGPLRVVPPRNHQPRRHVTAADWFDGLAAWDILHTNSGRLGSDVSRWMESIGTGYALELRHRVSYSFLLPATIAIAGIVVDKVRSVVDLDDEEQLQDGDVSVTVEVDPLSAKHSYCEVRELDEPTASTDVVLHPIGRQFALLPTEVGVGVSQVLPIVTAAVYFSRARSAFVAMEQPELHVHPRIQLGLGDLLIDAVTRADATDCTFLVETHSEHLMLRLLRRIREACEAEDDRLQPSMVAVWNIRHAEDAVEAKRMWIEPDGEFSEQWEGGFFHERGGELF